MRRVGPPLIAMLLFGVALAALGWQYLQRPTVLRVAVGPIGSEDVRLMAGVAQYLAREKSPYRFRLVLADSPVDAAKRLDEDKVQLAVIRSDQAIPVSGLTVMTLRRSYAVIVTAADRGIERITDLRGRRVGVSRNVPGNAQLLQTILAHYELPRDSVTIQFIDQADRGAVLKDGVVDAIFAVAPATSRNFADAVAAMARSVGEDKVRFIPIPEAEAIAGRNRAVEASDLVRGAFGGDPPRPPEPIKSVAITYRLMAQRTLSDSAAGEVTRLMLDAKQSLLAELPFAQGIEAPSTEKNDPLPLHPGSEAWLDGETLTFFERYGDWMYLGVMIVSIVGSIMAALVSRANTRERQESMKGLARLIDILHQVRATEDEATLDALQEEADKILETTLRLAVDHSFDQAGMNAYRIAIDQVSQAIAAQRQILAQSDDTVAMLS
ncbi:MAG: TAXI family TRAP transporter solute-binding subunit [Beijerinckiaceae bacterium]